VSESAGERHPDGAISVERRGPLLLIGLDRPEKYNGVTPKMFSELADAYTRLDEDPELRVGVLFGHGRHFTAGLDLPKWTESMRAGGRDRGATDRVDPAGLGRRCRKPLVCAYVANWLASFKEFPPRQKPASFSLDQVMQKLTEAAGSR
jgi:enoyl-CoA hydratase/carnithine racemase